MAGIGRSKHAGAARRIHQCAIRGGGQRKPVGVAGGRVKPERGPVAEKIADDGLIGPLPDPPAAGTGTGNTDDIADQKIRARRQGYGRELRAGQQIARIGCRRHRRVRNHNPADEAVAKKTAGEIIGAVGEIVCACEIV